MAYPALPLFQATSLPSKATSSLWSRAYEALRDRETQMVDRYENILSKELLEQAANTSASQEMPDQSRMKTDPDARWVQLQQIMNKGLQQADARKTRYTIFGHEFVPREQVARAAHFVGAIKGLISNAVQVSPEASLAWAGVCVLLPFLTDPTVAEQANVNGLSYVTSRIRFHVELERLLWPENLCEPGLQTEFENHIIDLYQCILEFQIKTVERFYRRWVANAGRDLIGHDDWEGMVSKIKQLEQVVREESSIVSTMASRDSLESISKVAQQHYDEIRSSLSVAKEHLHVSTQHRDVSLEQLAENKRTNQILEGRPIDLPTVHEARYDSADVQDSPRCESGTRIRVQETITQWADEKSPEPIFWLVGPAGIGKSTITRTLTDYLARQRRVAGYFFKRGERGRNDASRLFPTLATQLADIIPSFKDCLRKSLGGLDRDAVGKMGLEVQFDKLLWLPLGDLPLTDTSRLPGVIIIDVLDECESPEHLPRIMNLISKLCNITTTRLRLFFTSRSAPQIVDAFEPLVRNKTVRRVELHREFSEDAEADIRTLLKVRFEDIGAKRRVQQNPWPTMEELDRLVQLATNPEPLFIYAATLCRFVYDGQRPRNPKNQLKLWLKQSEEDKSQLHQTYAPILSQVLHPDQLEFDQQLQFLGAVVLLATPMSAVSLSSLLDIDMDDVSWWLPELYAVLDIPAESHNPIRPLHKSFSDFLLCPDDSDTSFYRVDAAGTHAMLAEKCIQRLKTGLKRDICNIRKLGATRDEISNEVIGHCVSADLKYACNYWVYHLERSGRSLDNYDYTFFYEHFLHWLEVLSLIGRFSDGVIAIGELLEIINRFPDIPSEFTDFAKDARRVMISFGPILERAPLQTYGAVLLFSPIASKVRQRLWNQRLLGLSRLQGVEPDWNAHRQTLEGHTGEVSAVAFSPDGQLLASASDDTTIRLWNAKTGTHLRTLEGHTGEVIAVAFSPDGQLIASAGWLDDNTVKIWNVAIGICQSTLQGHNQRVLEVAFSEDGHYVASALSNEAVRLWNVTTGTYQQIIEGYGDDDNSVFTVTVSPNLQLIARANYNAHTIRPQNLATGTHEYTLKGHSKRVTAVTFSADSQFVASGSDDKTIRLWNATTGTNHHTFEHHGQSITAICFSPDGQFLASGSRDKTIRLWNLVTGAHQNTIKVQSRYINTIAFSPDSQLLASGFRDGQVRVWDMQQDTPQESVADQSGEAYAIALSPDGQHVASILSDEVWDAETGIHQQTIRGYRGSISSVAYSPDGQLVASASSCENIVRLWNVATGKLLEVLEGHSDQVLEVAFSPDGQIVASSSLDKTVRLWDVSTGKHQQTFNVDDGDFPCVINVFFSSDSQIIAGLTTGRHVSLWDRATCSHLHTLTSGKFIRKAALSPNGQLVATVSETTVYLWGTKTGVQRRSVEDHEGFVEDVVFSPDSQLVAVALGDGAVRVWNVATLERLYTLTGHTAPVTKVKFSPEGQTVASASHDKTVRLWSSTTGTQLQVMPYGEGFVREMAFSAEELVMSVSKSKDDLDQFWNLWNEMALEFHRYPITAAAAAPQRGSSDAVSQRIDLSANEEWITKGGENLVWLPPQYRPVRHESPSGDGAIPRYARWSVGDSAIFIACASGRVVGLQFW